LGVQGRNAGVAGGLRLRPVLVACLLPLLGLGFGTTACASDGSGPGSDGDRAGRTGATSPEAQTSAGRLRFQRIANFSQPVEIKAAPGFPKLMFVVEQEGTIRVLRRGRKLSRPFLNIRSRVQAGGEQGLLSVGFPPDYRKSKLFYVYYTDSTGDIRIDEYKRRSSVRARANSRRAVITVPHRSAANHNGGQIHFLGRNMYFGTGDGGGAGDTEGNAQNLNSLLGKMIRINPRKDGRRSYTVPASNPFVGRPGRDEIYSYGLRNPFRWSFDFTGNRPRMAIADVGQNEFEEINYLTVGAANGANFGWNALEGFSEFEPPVPSGTRKPVLVLPHSDGYCSVIGGIVVRDPKLPALRGRYIFSDFCNGTVRSFKPRTSRVGSARASDLSGSQISSYAEGAGRAVYATSLAGPVYRIRQ
jgi:glucose/arabinose dehydrogenase